MLSAIGQISIVVHDVAKATAFYRDILGMPLLFEVPNMAFFDCGGVRLMLGPASSAEFDHAPSILYYRVDNIEAVYATLVERGVKFDQGPGLTARMPDHELWIAFFRDCENNLMALMCEKR